MIIQSAIQKDGKIYTGRRHHEIINRTHPKGALKGGIQGFITDKGLFLTREEGAAYAYQNGQISSLKSKLFSEDLW